MNAPNEFIFIFTLNKLIHALSMQQLLLCYDHWENWLIMFIIKNIFTLFGVTMKTFFVTLYDAFIVFKVHYLCSKMP